MSESVSLTPGAYTLTLPNLNNWQNYAQTCTSSVAGKTVTLPAIQLEADETISCTFRYLQTQTISVFKNFIYRIPGGSIRETPLAVQILRKVKGSDADYAPIPNYPPVRMDGIPDENCIDQCEQSQWRAVWLNMPLADVETGAEYQYFPEEVEPSYGFAVENVITYNNPGALYFDIANVRQSSITIITEARPNTTEPFTYRITQEGQPDIQFDLVDNWTAGEGTPEDLARQKRYDMIVPKLNFNVKQIAGPANCKLVDVHCDFPLQGPDEPEPTPEPTAVPDAEQPKSRPDLVAHQTSPSPDKGVYDILAMYLGIILQPGNEAICTFVNEKTPDLPETGFPMISDPQALPAQPDGLDYGDTGLTLDIPILDVSAPLVTVPLN